MTRGGSAEKKDESRHLDGLAAYVPAIRAGVRALRHEVRLAQASFRPTDEGIHAKDARTLERLADQLDVRCVRYCDPA